ncbi:hypothetical protein ACPYO6_05560 [Georgenia sp. Z1344]|uniref:hypothetical protein n=1 Tax=Georgenia sp. Z1344 TaxID=3416706 RepID=UPI003CE8E80E
MTTEPSSTAADRPQDTTRMISMVAVVLTMAWGIGWIWVGDTGAQPYYLWIGAPLIALMWMAIAWSSRRGDRR